MRINSNATAKKLNRDAGKRNSVSQIHIQENSQDETTSAVRGMPVLTGSCLNQIILHQQNKTGKTQVLSSCCLLMM